jgi:hypothetical protein
MNAARVSELLQETGTSHRFITDTAIRIDKLIDGVSRPVLVFDCYTNKVTRMPDFSGLSMKEAGRMEFLQKRLKQVNVKGWDKNVRSND